MLGSDLQAQPSGLAGGAERRKAKQHARGSILLPVMAASEEHIEHRGNPPRAAIVDGPPLWAVVRLNEDNLVYDGLPRQRRVLYVARSWGVSKERAAAVVAYCEEHRADIAADIQEVEATQPWWPPRPGEEAARPAASPGKTATPVPGDASQKHIVRRGHPRQAAIVGGPPVWAVALMSGIDGYANLSPGQQPACVARTWEVTEEQAAAALAYYWAHDAQIRRDLLRVQRDMGYRRGVGRVMDALARLARWLQEPLSVAARLLILLAVLLAGWVLFGLAHGTFPVWVTFLGGGLVVSASFVLLFLFFLHADEELPDWSVFAAFVLAFAGLVGAYAAASLVASHEVMAVHGQTYDCYRDSDGGVWLHGLDAVYVALGTLTTSGAGEIVAHRDVCRALSVGELSIGFAMLGLTVAGVGTRLFPARSQQRTH